MQSFTSLLHWETYRPRDWANATPWLQWLENPAITFDSDEIDPIRKQRNTRQKTKSLLPDGLLELNLPQTTVVDPAPPGLGALLRLDRHRVRLLPQLIQELETQAPAGALVAVDGGAHEDEVGAEELLDEREGDGGGLVDDDELGLAELVGVGGVDVLDRLPVGVGLGLVDVAPVGGWKGVFSWGLT